MGTDEKATIGPMGSDEGLVDPAEGSNKDDDGTKKQAREPTKPEVEIHDGIKESESDNLGSKGSLEAKDLESRVLPDNTSDRDSDDIKARTGTLVEGNSPGRESLAHETIAPTASTESLMASSEVRLALLCTIGKQCSTPHRQVQNRTEFLYARRPVASRFLVDLISCIVPSFHLLFSIQNGCNVAASR